MSFLEHVADRAGTVIPGVKFDGGRITYKRETADDEQPTTFRFVHGQFKTEAADVAYEKYKRAKSKSFDPATLALVINGTVERALVALTPLYFREGEFVYTDRQGNSVTIAPASWSFILGHMDSSAYSDLHSRRSFLHRTAAMIDELWYRGVTATYRNKGHKIPSNLQEIAAQKIGAALFKMAVEDNRVCTLWRPNRRSSRRAPSTKTPNNVLPNVRYDENAVRYFMVAKSSPFPSQAFVAFYNVLEYYFLSTAEDKLHHRLRAHLNAPSFSASAKGLDDVITIVRSEDAQREELNMLRNVIDRFVTDQELADFISAHESERGEKVFSKRRTIFGEGLEVSLSAGHCRANAAKAIKHIRNAIVHSSDRYKREECHIPLSDSEHIVDDFVPLIQFLAERVIYGTAS